MVWSANVAPTARSSMPRAFVPFTRSRRQRPMSQDRPERLTSMIAMSTTDEPTFNAAVERHRRELHVHCYRMLGNFEEAEDALQEALLRGWRSRDSFAGDSGLRPWLYRIATNVCLDMLRASKRRVPTLESIAEVPWLQP